MQFVDLMGKRMEEVKVQIRPSSLKELVLGGQTFRSTLDFHLSKADLERSCKELKETKEVRENSLEKFKELLARDKDIRYRTDDAYLLRYLRYRKFDYKNAYKVLCHFYRSRVEHPDLFHLSLNKELHLNSRIINLMPYRNEEGTLIFIIKYGNWKTDELKIPDLLRVFNLLSDIVSLNPHCQINGVIGIWDFAGLSMSHIAQAVQPSTLRICSTILQEMYPWRVKKIILFNCSSVFYTTFIGIRYLLKKKIADRVTLLRSDLSQLHKYVNPVLLPKEYGGSLEDSECYSYAVKPILDNVEYLKYEHSFINLKKL